MQQMVWDDFRILLALARAETLAGAAKLLGFDATTVSRRIKGMERSTGVALIHRNRSGRSILSEVGQRLAEHAEKMEQHVVAADGLLGKNTPLSGTVRVTAVPFLLNRLLAPWVSGFSRQHPCLDISLIPDGRNLSLTRREVDVALRFAEPQDGGSAILAQKVGCIAFSVFTANDDMQLAVEDRPWLTYDPVAAHLPQAKWTSTLMHQQGGSASKLLIHDLETAFETAATSDTRAVLPAVAARLDPRLQELPAPLTAPEMGRDVWLLRHADMRGIERVDAIVSCLAKANLFGEAG